MQEPDRARLRTAGNQNGDKEQHGNLNRRGDVHLTGAESDLGQERYIAWSAESSVCA